jgi:hypothetical protein
MSGLSLKTDQDENLLQTFLSSNRSYFAIRGRGRGVIQKNTFTDHIVFFT